MTDRVQAIPTVQSETEWARVTRWDFPPHSETGFHRHEYDYVVVPVTNGRLRLEDPVVDGGEPDVTFGDLQIGVSYDRSHGVEHNVINDNDFPVAFVEIERL